MKERRRIPCIPDEEQDWGFVAGDYSRFKGIVVERPNWAESYEGLPIEQLRGSELFFRDIIAFYLEKNKDNRVPTIAWDVGAMAATTWVRLGAAFKKEVGEGVLVLVASSLTYSPKKHGFRRHVTRKGTAFLQTNGHLVHYQTATADTFRDMFVTLPSGQRLSLAGQVQIVHEADSLSRYSMDPEYEIEQLGKMVAPDGVYFTRGGFPYSDHLREDAYKDNEHLLSVFRAHHNLTTNLGFTMINQAEGGLKKGQDLIYTVFKRPGAPLITPNK